MTIKDAILKTLEDLDKACDANEVLEYINSKHLWDSSNSQKPIGTVSANLGRFIRRGDTRVKRIKGQDNIYLYYLSRNEDRLGIEILSQTIQQGSENVNKKSKIDDRYKEKALHKLLSTYLNSKDIYSKTISHEKSSSTSDKNQIWTHPDMVGVSFLDLNAPTRNFIDTVNKMDIFKIYSYEVKTEINTDTELKEFFFQAVSNSSWANFGYLVALKFGMNLLNEMKRLNDSFGIGFIELNPNPFSSKELFQAKSRSLDIKTIDKLIGYNNIDFKQFIEQVDKTIGSSEKTRLDMEKALKSFCDPYFNEGDDDKIIEYCNEKKIPIETDDEGQE